MSILLLRRREHLFRSSFVFTASCDSGIALGLLYRSVWHRRCPDNIYISSMASPRGRPVKILAPGKLNELSKNFTLMLLVEKEPQKRSYKNKDGSDKTYCAFHGIGEDGLRQDCVFFGEAYEKMPEIAQGS